MGGIYNFQELEGSQGQFMQPTELAGKCFPGLN